MDKVHILYKEDEEGCDILVGVFKTLFAAKKGKKQIEDRIEEIKEKYFLEYGSNFDGDKELLFGEDLIMEDEDLYDKLNDQYYGYYIKFEELGYRDLRIEEVEIKD
jgi:hypothetical protein